MYGEIHDSKSVFLREYVETIAGPELKIQYAMTITCAGREPLIRSYKTGKYFLLSWPDILKLAIEAGIDND